MFYRIAEVSTDKVSEHTYVLVHFWKKRADYRAGKPSYRVNDFLMQLRPTGKQLIDPDDPGKGTETFDRDLPAEIKSNIEAYWERAEKGNYPTDHSNSRLERDNRDPHSILTRPDVVALRDTEVDKA